MMKKTAIKMFEVIRDKQEKEHYWNFPIKGQCLGTKDESLKTGDYTITGMENIFTIERKWSTGEFSRNICESRFERELVRMDKLKHSFLLLEFTLADVYNFPMGSGIPGKVWPNLKITPSFIIKRIVEIETDHKVKVIFGGNNCEEIAYRIFKRMVELYG